MHLIRKLFRIPTKRKKKFFKTQILKILIGNIIILLIFNNNNLERCLQTLLNSGLYFIINLIRKIKYIL